MKKKKIVAALLVSGMIFSSLFNTSANAATHTHSWKILNGGYIPPSYSTHYFNHTHSDGATYYESCEVVRVFSYYVRECTVCGTTETVESSSYTHNSTHCPQH